jgi:hypothetical protein
MRNFEQGLHKASTSAPPPTSNGARAPGTVASRGAASFPSSAPSPPQDHGSQAPAASAASARAAPGAGIFDGLHSIPGDLVDLLTKNGGFAFLENLHETGDDDDLLLFLQKQNLASAIYLFGLGTRLSGQGLKHMR